MASGFDSLGYAFRFHWWCSSCHHVTRFYSGGNTVFNPIKWRMRLRRHNQQCNWYLILWQWIWFPLSSSQTAVLTGFVSFITSRGITTSNATLGACTSTLGWSTSTLGTGCCGRLGVYWGRIMLLPGRKTACSHAIALNCAVPFVFCLPMIVWAKSCNALMIASSGVIVGCVMY